MNKLIVQASVRRNALQMVGQNIVTHIEESYDFGACLFREYKRARSALDDIGVSTASLHDQISEDIGKSINLKVIDKGTLEEVIKIYPTALAHINYAEISLGDTEKGSACLRGIVLNTGGDLKFADAVHYINIIMRMVFDADFTAHAINVLTDYADHNQISGLALQDVVTNVANILLAHAENDEINTELMDKYAARLFSRGFDKERPAVTKYRVIDKLLSSPFKRAGMSAYKFLNFLPANFDTYLNLYQDHGVYGSEASDLRKIDWAPSNSIFPAAGIIKLKLAKGDVDGYSEILNRVAEKHLLLEEVIIATSAYPTVLDEAFENFADAVFSHVSRMHERTRSKLLSLFEANDNGALFKKYARESGKYSRLMINHELSI